MPVLAGRSSGGMMERGSSPASQMKLRNAFIIGLMLLLGVPVRAELSAGDKVPDCELLDQYGRSFHLDEFKGQVLALTFIFTRCPLPSYCPRLSAQFREAQDELSKDKTAGPWHLISLSFDDEHDHPPQLKAYADVYHADPAHWTMGTGKPDVVRRFGSLFGLTAVMEEGLLNHNLRTVVVDAGGHVQCVFKGNDWTAKDLLWEMRKAMAGR